MEMVQVMGSTSEIKISPQEAALIVDTQGNTTLYIPKIPGTEVVPEPFVVLTALMIYLEHHPELIEQVVAFMEHKTNENRNYVD